MRILLYLREESIVGPFDNNICTDNLNCSYIIFQKQLRPDATGRGAFWGHAPQMTACASQTKIVPPKRGLCLEEINMLVLLECKSRPKTPKLVLTALEFVSKNCFFVIFVELHRILLNF